MLVLYIIMNEKGDLLCVCSSEIDGTLQENMQCLKTTAKALPDGTGKQHLLALAAVANYIIVNGPVVKTQDAEGVNE